MVGLEETLDVRRGVGPTSIEMSVGIVVVAGGNSGRKKGANKDDAAIL